MKLFRVSNHPANRLPQDLRNEVTQKLNVVLGVNLGNNNGQIAYHVYSSEVNTIEKLQKNPMQRTKIQGIELKKACYTA